MEGDGRVGEFVGGYTDWVRQRGPQVAAVQSTRSAPARPSQGGQTKRRMSFKEQKELEQLPARIEQLEAKIAQLTETMHDPAFYQRDSAAIVAHNAQLAEVQAQLDIAYGRWMELDAG
jgi:ATP-binding cassette subfamily F protein uup